MATRKDPDAKPESRPQPTLTEAAEKAGLVIRRLQSRLRDRDAGPDLGDAAKRGSRSEDLDRELEEYFHHVAVAGGRPGSGHDIMRSRVVDEVVDRILREWDAPGDENSLSIEREIMERLVDRLLDRLSS